MPTWRLTDADVVAAAHKYTFYKPPQKVIERVAPGQHVKLIFEFDSDDPGAPGAERMWVIVDEILGHGRYRGRLDNEPAWIEDLAHDDSLEFEDCHIIATQHDAEDEENVVDRYLARCLVTHRVLHEGIKVGYLYREAPDRKDDSGWRVTSNTESEEYLNSADNLSAVSLGAVLNLDDSFVHLLDEPAGSAFERDEATGKFFPVHLEH